MGSDGEHSYSGPQVHCLHIRVPLFWLMRWRLNVSTDYIHTAGKVRGVGGVFLQLQRAESFSSANPVSSSPSFGDLCWRHRRIELALPFFFFSSRTVKPSRFHVSERSSWTISFLAFQLKLLLSSFSLSKRTRTTYIRFLASPGSKACWDCWKELHRMWKGEWNPAFFSPLLVSIYLKKKILQHSVCVCVSESCGLYHRLHGVCRISFFPCRVRKRERKSRWKKDEC